MFFKLAVLKRMLKKAYKTTGIIVGRTVEGADGNPDGYYIASGFWVMWFYADKMPKEAKAAVIELCGDLPEAGEAFKATEGGGNQYEMGRKEAYDLPGAFEKCGCRFRVTKLLWQQDGATMRFIQEDGKTNRVAEVQEIFMELIDPDAVDTADGEYPPDGPVSRREDSPFMYWGNNRCYLMACTREPAKEDEKAFWKALEGCKIP